LAKSDLKMKRLKVSEKKQLQATDGVDPLAGVKKLMTTIVMALSPDACLRLPRDDVALETRKSN
jgi:hypothetical protein